MCSGISKVGCCLAMHEFPPDPLMVACCGKFIVGNPEGAHTARIHSLEQAEQLGYQKDAFWLYYCCCSGAGLVRCADPLCESQSKVCCALDRCETTACMNDEGCLNSQTKCCCCASFNACDCKMSPGIGCCGFTVMKNFGPLAAEGLMARELEETLVPAQQAM